MKFSKYFLGIFSLILIFSFSMLAQEKEKMTKEEKLRFKRKTNQVTQRTFFLNQQSNLIRQWQVIAILE